MEKYQNKLFYIMGAVSGLYCLRINNISLIFFPLFIIIIISILGFIKKPSIKLNIMDYYYFCILISLIVGVRYGELFYYNLKSFELIKIILFLTITIFFKINKESIHKFIAGIKLTIFLNIVWGTLEFISWETKGFLLNNYIFGDILNIDTGGHGWIYLRSLTRIGLCGFSWDPLHLGILSALGVIIYKNKILKLYSLIILLLCGSRAGIVGLSGCYLISYFMNNLKNINFKKLILNYILLIGILFSMVLFFKYKVNHDNIGDKRRKAYYISAIKSTLLKNKIETFLFGGSPFYSGNILASDIDLAKKTYLGLEMYKMNWKIESDWAHILTGRGWVGLFNYFFVFFISYFKAKESILKKSILLYFVAGIGYYFESSLYINLVLIYINQNYRLKGVKNERNNTRRWKWNKALSYNKSNIKTNKSDI